MKWLKGVLEFGIGIVMIVLIVLALRYKDQIWEYSQQSIASIWDKDSVSTTALTEAEESVYDSEEEPEQDSIEPGDSESEVEPIVENTKEEEKNITISLAGDILLTGYLLGQYDDSGISALVSDDILSELKNSDIFIANEEFPFSSGGVAAEDKKFTFRTEPNRVSIFNELGLDIVTLANNHSLDYGTDALLDTFDALDNAGIQYVGAGKDLNRAEQLQTFTIENQTIGILAASRVIPEYDWNATASKPGVFTTYDAVELVNQIAIANESCDYVIVYVHWGIEKQDTPEEYQRNLAKQYIDAGADLVVGSHPHVLQGIEYYNGKPIIYSLGNFIFGSQIEATGILQVDLSSDGEASLSFLACKTDTDYTLQLVSDASEIYSNLTELSVGAKVAEEGHISSTDSESVTN